jgi:hypothetical protein
MLCGECQIDYRKKILISQPLRPPRPGVTPPGVPWGECNFKIALAQALSLQRWWKHVESTATGPSGTVVRDLSPSPTDVHDEPATLLRILPSRVALDVLTAGLRTPVVHACQHAKVVLNIPKIEHRRACTGNTAMAVHSLGKVPFTSSDGQLPQWFAKRPGLACSRHHLWRRSGGVVGDGEMGCPPVRCWLQRLATRPSACVEPWWWTRWLVSLVHVDLPSHRLSSCAATTRQ